ncbi:medium-chain acyl-CoA ligase ACSF2, mitochondrial-like isoform X2 [Amphiura filiformis]|uniref:medium-chain acyl-CoA ligase ACSF2, mitochondrial-like isoform X2 n=1 Tax=Amphiura filiformis TaxID=82378 RepID=UPI003B221F10
MSVVTRQLSYSHGTGDIPLFPYTIGQMLNKTAQEYPDNEMYVFYADKERYTFSKFRDQTHQFAAGLLKLGLQKGDRIAVMGVSHKEYMLTYHACAQIGLILVRVIPSHFELQLKMLGCKAVVLTRTPVEVYEVLCKFVPELPISEPGKLNSSRGILTVGNVIELGGSSTEAVEHITAMAWDIDNEDDFCVIFTSGSTGSPKATMHSQGALLNWNRASGIIRRETGFEADWIPKVAVIMTAACISQEYGLLHPVLTGQTTVFTCPMFNAELTLKAVHEEKCTEAVMLIHHIYDLLNHPDLDKYDWSSMKCIMTGGSVIPDSIMIPAKEKLSKHIMLVYACTEMNMIAIQCPLDNPKNLSSGAIYAVPHTEIQIVDENEQTVPTNTIGEIYVRSPYVFKYYWSDEEATRKSRDRNGWYRTGDLGIMDNDGFLRCFGRKQDVISKEGCTLFPKELEDVLDQHSDVSKAVVFGVPDKRTLDEVCACVKMTSSTDTSSQDLIDYCQGKVFEELVPRYVFIISEIPTTLTGKFHRKKLRDWAIEQLKRES